ncbi:hypothetical protein BCR43DRAFT_516451 [Syncephalastrum racemosum]|uniref:Uncharacterized protein n=1 Tax=Syncephalastrum racemosum TaxID=13706 RepID=A0A1X2H8B7_SYNRA|nr:hypothetical protein BCR43DRAFT_516451 [Syncephalastrum racemosum]
MLFYSSFNPQLYGDDSAHGAVALMTVNQTEASMTGWFFRHLPSSHKDPVIAVALSDETTYDFVDGRPETVEEYRLYCQRSASLAAKDAPTPITSVPTAYLPRPCPLPGTCYPEGWSEKLAYFRREVYLGQLMKIRFPALTVYATCMAGSSAVVITEHTS